MSLTNKEIADIFANIADILEIQGENRFKYLSYRTASEVIQDLPRDLRAYADDGTLTEIKGVGKAIAEKIQELLETGKLEYYEKRKAEVPLGVVDIMRINGVGPKKAKLFWDELGITSIEGLKEAADAGQLRELPGMGEKSEDKVIAGIEALARRGDRIPIGKVKPVADAVLEKLMALPQSIKGSLAGSIRRGRTTIGDVDILIASDEPAPIMDTFVSMDNVARILGHGPTKSSVELQNGIQMDLRILPLARWGTALQYFTGSKDHNVRIREIALNKGYSLNEHALRPVDDDGNLKDESTYVYCETEEDVYKHIGLPWIPPEIRENTGEVEAAQRNELPRLITLDDIQGDLHMHTNASDGKLSLEDMVNAARERGRKYIVITDHSQRSYQANGLDAERLMAQQNDVRAINDKYDDIEVLHGVEMDIREDGTLDLPDDILSQLDFVVASLHFGLSQPRERVTKRLLNAVNNPHVDLIGHMTGRLIGSRDGADVDFDAVFEAAAASGIAFEINANPRRLDLDSQYVRRAAEMGIPIAIDTDAHSARMLDHMSYGILTARRGWLTAAQVINTWDFETFINWVRARGQ